MKTLFAFAATALFASSAFAADVVKDRSGAYSCQKNGEVLAYYQPFGRVPSTAEQLTCAKAGGRILQPNRKAPQAPRPKTR